MRSILNFIAILSLLFICNYSYSQKNGKGRIALKDTVLYGKLKINPYDNSIELKTNKEKKKYYYDETSSVYIEGTQIIKIEPSNAPVALVVQIVCGKANVYEDFQKNIYLQTNSFEIRRIDTEDFSSSLGVLKVYFADCTMVMERIENLEAVSNQVVKDFSRNYNNCNNNNQEERKFIEINPENAPAVLVEQVINGKANVYEDSKKNIYLETNNLGIRRIDKENFASSLGILKVYFADCVEVRRRIMQLEAVSNHVIKDFAENYNSCLNYK